MATLYEFAADNYSLKRRVLFFNAVNICFSTIQIYYSVTNKNAILTLGGRKILYWECPKDELEIKTKLQSNIFSEQGYMAGYFWVIFVVNLFGGVCIGLWYAYGHAFTWHYMLVTWTTNVTGERWLSFLMSETFVLEKEEIIADNYCRPLNTQQVHTLHARISSCSLSWIIVGGEINSLEAKNHGSFRLHTRQGSTPFPYWNCTVQAGGQIQHGNEATGEKMR